MTFFIIIVVITAIISSLYFLFFTRYIKSKIAIEADDSFSDRRDSDMVDSSDHYGEAEHLVSESEIANIESLINRKLPGFYKEFLMNYPRDLITLGAPYNTVSELSLPYATASIVDLNALEFVPADILVIGEDGLGNIYYNILSDKNSIIYLFNHEDPKYLNSSESEIDWHASWDIKFHDLNEMISFLKKSLSE